MENLVIQGQVAHGLSRGKQLGFPTFNLDLEEKYSLQQWLGVWCSYTYYQGKKLPSVTHIGPVRIYGENDIRVETHILDWDQDIYGETMKIELLHKLRDTRDFSDQSELVEQIKEDVRQAKVYFKLED